MRPARGLVRLVTPLAIALGVGVLSVAFVGGRGVAQASTPASQGAPGSAGGASAPAGPDEGGGKKKARKPGARSNSKKISPRSKSSPATKVTRSKSSHLAPQKLARAQAGKSGTKTDTINEDVTLTPFPSHAGAAKKALAQNRRDQLEDAEKAARAPEQAERWQTVLFHLRDLDARSDSEGCFWRLVSYYRLGQIERARTLRPGCELAPKDTAIIEAEDEQAAHLQAAGMLADKDPAPVGNLAPYAGDGPAKSDR